ncbi:hypothetical protein BC834DRAFT_892616 [Gloeopeniophorella convolvens]|nr:hypothetical protein BC834DRAFT_892616 [Gloeopeniophorella convolvens]
MSVDGLGQKFERMSLDRRAPPSDLIIPWCVPFYEAHQVEPQAFATSTPQAVSLRTPRNHQDDRRCDRSNKKHLSHRGVIALPFEDAASRTLVIECPQDSTLQGDVRAIYGSKKLFKHQASPRHKSGAGRRRMQAGLEVDTTLPAKAHKYRVVKNERKQKQAFIRMSRGMMSRKKTVDLWDENTPPVVAEEAPSADAEDGRQRAQKRLKDVRRRDLSPGSNYACVAMPDDEGRALPPLKNQPWIIDPDGSLPLDTPPLEQLRIITAVMPLPSPVYPTSHGAAP